MSVVSTKNPVEYPGSNVIRTNKPDGDKDVERAEQQGDEPRGGGVTGVATS